MLTDKAMFDIVILTDHRYVNPNKTDWYIDQVLLEDQLLQTALEEKELNKWLNQSESDLKVEYGQPDKVEFLKTRNRNYFYISEKLKIKCERKFEINQNNMVLGFSSKNCF